MDRHKEVETVNDNRMDTALQESINKETPYAKHIQDTFETLGEFQQIWTEIWAELIRPNTSSC